jgi:hypothetical protein
MKSRAAAPGRSERSGHRSHEHLKAIGVSYRGAAHCYAVWVLAPTQPNPPMQPTNAIEAVLLGRQVSQQRHWTIRYHTSFKAD